MRPRLRTVPWNKGDVIPAGKPLADCQFIKFRDDFPVEGQGTRDDPLIRWACIPGYTTGQSQEETRRLNSNKLIVAARAQGVVNIAKEVARDLMMYYIIIRANNHSFATQREARTGAKTGTYVPAYSHITLHLSDEPDTVKVGGHVYTDENEARIPLNITAPEDRPLVRGVPDRSVELFAEGRPPSRSWR